MAHFAKLENNVVTQVIVVSDGDCNNLEFPDSEPVGQKFISDIGLSGNWLQTSYNKKFRKHFAGAGYVYDSSIDAFLPPKPFSSWILDTNSYLWVPPVPYPAGNDIYSWNENNKSWVRN